MDKEGTPVVITNNGQYRLYKYASEKELEEFVVDHAQILFGKDTVYFDTKKKISSKAGTSAIPDGYLIDTERNKLHIIEVELSSHDIVGHIMNQVFRFEMAMGNEASRKELLACLSKDMNRKKLDFGKIRPDFGVFIIIDSISDKLGEVVKSLSAKGIEVTAIPFETYIGPDKSILHKFTTFTEEALEKEAKKWSFKWTTVPIEQHLNKANADMQSVLKELSGRICGIGPDVKEVPRKAWMTYQTAPLKNFCTVKILKDALEVNIKADGAFSDKKGIAKGIARTPAWTFDKVFQVRSKDELDYAISLIKQAYRCTCG